MRPWLVTLLLPFWIAGCGYDPEQELVGAWTPDVHQTKIPIASPEMAAPFLGLVSLKLRPDRSFSLTMGQVLEGRWSLQGEQVMFTSKRRGEPVTIKAQVQKDPLRIMLPRETPVGPVLFVMRKSG